MCRRHMTRTELLAAEIYSYSYANYHDHLGINLRFDKLMPESVEILERASDEEWPMDRLAEELNTPIEEATTAIEALNRARDVVDAENPAESFRCAVKLAVTYALKKGITDPEAVDDLVKQICYCAADLAYLLKRNGETLSRYSRHLRRETDEEYYEGYFDEEE